METPAVEVAELVCRYAGRPSAAVDGVSFDVPAGGTLALLGPNGSGKTTLFRVLATLLTPTAGVARLHGSNVTGDRNAARRLTGIVFQSPALDRELTPRENLAYHGRMAGLSRAAAARQAGAMLDRVGLDADSTTPAKHLSGGMRRRVEIARALLTRPRVLLLDEPTTGLDPAARRDMWQLIASLRREQPTTLVVSTHLLDDLEGDGAACDRIVLLDRGRVVADDTPDRLRERIGGDVVTLVPETPHKLDALLALAGDGAVAADGRVRVERPDGRSLAARLLSDEADTPVRLREVTVARPTLNDVFLNLTGRPLEDVSASLTRRTRSLYRTSTGRSSGT